MPATKPAFAISSRVRRAGRSWQLPVHGGLQPVEQALAADAVYSVAPLRFYMVFPDFLPDWFVVMLLLTVGPVLTFAFAYLLLRIGEALARRSGGWLLRLLAVLVMATVPTVALSSLWSVLGELETRLAIITTVIAYVGGAVLVVNWFGGIFAPTLTQGHFDQALDGQTKTIIDAMDDQTKTITDAIDRLAEASRERDERMLSVLTEILEELRTQRTGTVDDAT